jgi:hypothetical protein
MNGTAHSKHWVGGAQWDTIEVIDSVEALIEICSSEEEEEEKGDEQEEAEVRVDDDGHAREILEPL